MGWFGSDSDEAQAYDQVGFAPSVGGHLLSNNV